VGNIFCTLALGRQHAGYARFLADDLGDFKQTLAVVTDQPELFRRCRNVVLTPHYPTSFSYHDKRIALQAALKLGNTAIFIDADCALRFGVPRGLVRQAFAYEFEPGFHGWSIAPADVYDYGHTEQLGRSWGLSFDRKGKRKSFFSNYGNASRKRPGRGISTVQGKAPASASRHKRAG